MCLEESSRSSKSTKASSQTSTRTDARTTSLKLRKSPLFSRCPRQQNPQKIRKRMPTVGASHRGFIRTHSFTSAGPSTSSSTQANRKSPVLPTDRQLVTASKRSTSKELLMSDTFRAGNTASQTLKCRMSRFTMILLIYVRLEKLTCEIKHQLGDD